MELLSLLEQFEPVRRSQP